MRRGARQPAFVSFEETNVVGNVYYVNYLRWQGRVRELFLKQNAPEILAEIQSGLALVTTRCSCDFFAELAPFDEVIIRMRLMAVAQNRISMAFEYWRPKSNGEELVARGEQEVACMSRTGDAGAAAVRASAETAEIRLRPFTRGEISMQVCFEKQPDISPATTEVWHRQMVQRAILAMHERLDHPFSRETLQSLPLPARLCFLFRGIEENVTRRPLTVQWRTPETIY
jgi:enediyne core biosynthesis thioesterase